MFSLLSIVRTVILMSTCCDFTIDSIEFSDMNDSASLTLFQYSSMMARNYLELNDFIQSS